MLSYHVESGAGPRWALNPARPADFQMPMQAVQIGSLTLSRASLSQAGASTRPKPFRRTSERSYNIYIVDRTQHLVLGGQALVLQPGDFTLADSALTSTIVTDEPYTTIGLTVPASFLRAYVHDPDRAVGVRFPGTEGLSRVVSLMLRELWRMAEAGTLNTIGNRLVVSLFEAFSACCELTQPSQNGSASSAAARRTQIREAIHNRLRDPELSLRSLARDLGLSTRYLQMIFNEGEDSISRYIRRQRLESCRRELADPAWCEHSVTGIAFRWGFNSASHFCRAFHAHYGMSPSRLREQALEKAGCARASVPPQKRHSGLTGAPVAPGMRSGAVVRR
jgi:AraC family transcriptional regulator, positive regulator of tynA and feaB